MEYNDHLPHFEDLPLVYGPTGLNRAWLMADRILRTLVGSEDFKLFIKWDGSVSFLFGRVQDDIFAHPCSSKEKLFVAGKSKAFSKTGPVWSYDFVDLKKHYPESLANELAIIARNLTRSVPETMSQIYQADLLFIKEPVSSTLEFTPNVVSYKLRQSALSAKVGLSVHSQYSLDRDGRLSKANPIYDDLRLNENPSIWIAPRYVTLSEVPTYTKHWQQKIKAHLASIISDIDDADFRLFLQKIVEPTAPYPSIASRFMALENVCVRENVRLHDDSVEKVRERFLSHIETAYDRKINELKTEKSRAAWNSQKISDLSFLHQSRKKLDMWIKTWQSLREINNEVRSIATIIAAIQYMDVSASPEHEGFVGYDAIGATKFVNRYGFSQANFAKWDKKKEENAVISRVHS